eukprot:6669269-Prymnesium_polylepis.1
MKPSGCETMSRITTPSTFRSSAARARAHSSCASCSLSTSQCRVELCRAQNKDDTNRTEAEKVVAPMVCSERLRARV